MIFGLALQHPGWAPGFVDHRILFGSDPQVLAAPFTDGGSRGELDRKPAARQDEYIAATGHTLLTVPQADQRSRTVSVIADRMSVDRAVDTFRLHRRKCVRQYFVARAARLYSLH